MNPGEDPKLSILLVEDNPSDAELVGQALEKEGLSFSITRALSRKEFEAGLERGGVDLILSDFSLPGFDGLSALAIAREKTPEIPFIFVTGTMGEERAVESLKGGAVDYVLKGSLQRLGPAVRRALGDVKERKKREQADITNIAERKKGDEDLKLQVRRLACLRDIALAIAACVDLRITLNVILDQTLGQLGVSAAAILTYHDATQTLDFAAGRGFRAESNRNTHLRLGQNYAGKAALSRTTVHIPDLRRGSGEFVRSHKIDDESFAGYFATPLMAKGKVKGVIELFDREPVARDQGWIDFMHAIADQAAIAIDSARMFEDIERANFELSDAYERTLEGWVAALDLRDKETEGHTQRVTELTVRLARAHGMADPELIHVRRGALLHDIGKLGIPDAILLKEGPLTDDEWVVMRKHPGYAFQWLSPIDYLRPALDIPYCHHEKWDGTGYPRGLAGETIPLSARIFAIVDVWDALRSDRPYRKAWPVEKTLDHIKSGAGKHFDPSVVDEFVGLQDWSLDVGAPHGLFTPAS